MMQAPCKIHTERYRNWVKGALGLFYLQEGLQNFTDTIVQNEHGRIFQSFGTCSSCHIRNILPAHACGVSCIQKNVLNCNCRRKSNRPCHVCGSLYDEIIKLHRYNDPNWETDSTKWCSDHWQFAKCFLTTTSKTTNNTASETDAAGLLSIIINGKFFQQYIQCHINPPYDTFSQAKQTRNDILHSPSQELTDNELQIYIQIMTSVLEDPKTLVKDTTASTAVAKLRQMMNDTFVITTAHETKAINNALKAIQEAREEAEESIKRLAEQRKQVIVETTDQCLAKFQTDKEQISVEINSAIELQLQDLKTGQEDHETRLQNIEAKVHTIDADIGILKDQLSTFKEIEKNHYEVYKYLQCKYEFQQKLINLYRKHFVYTAVSPLKARQNDIEIHEVYVSPKMTLKGQPDDEFERKEINSYREIFSRDGNTKKKIFILGEVGSGKSSFCKMMIHNWCQGKSYQSKETTDFSFVASTGDEADNEISNDCDHLHENIQEMQKFDFLFFISMSHMCGYTDIHDMIKVHYQRISPATIIDDILNKESDKCLVLVDGLDEWTPPRKKKSYIPPYITHGLPITDPSKSYTMITMSRPSTPGVLNIRSTEIDQIIHLLGIDSRSTEKMIEKYLAKLCKGRTPGEFLSKLKDSKLQHLEEVPMLLQQILWVFCQKDEIGKSASEIYSSILNILFAWAEEKDVEYHDTSCGPEEMRRLQLPTLLDRYPKCKKHKNLILLLGKIAFELQISDEQSSVVLGRSKLEDFGLSITDISFILNLGILTEDNCFDPTYEKSYFMFIHTSFLEYFAALYIASHTSNLSNTPKRQYLFTRNEALEKLFKKCVNAQDIAQFKNIIALICGLAPYLTTKLLQHIYEIDSDDRRLSEYRMLMHRPHIYINEIETSALIQELAIQCLCNCMSSGGPELPNVSICDVSVEPATSESFLEQVVTDHVLSLNISYFDVKHFTDTMIRILIGFNYLHTIKIQYCTLSHQLYIELSKSLKQIMYLKAITLEAIGCEKPSCEGHVIDLSNHDKLKHAHLCSRTRFYVSHINKTNLETFELHTDLPEEIICVRKAQHLRKISLNVKDFRAQKRYNKKINSMLQSLPHLQKLELLRVSIEENAFYLTEKNQEMSCVKLFRANMDISTWRHFVDSLLTLPHRVQVFTTATKIVKGEAGIAEEYVQNNENFNILLRKEKQFDFETK